MRSYPPPARSRSGHGASGLYKNVARCSRVRRAPTPSSVLRVLRRTVRAGLVTFEGIDGSGKSTVSRRVADRLRERGTQVFLTGEPTHGWLGDAVRRSYKDDVGPVAEAFLFLADRAVHQEEIRSHIAAGEVVVSDRYADSTYAYQGARLAGTLDRPMEFLQRVSKPWLRVPDLTLLLRVSADAGLARIANRVVKVRFEDLSFLKKVAANYDRLATSSRFVTLDATRAVDAVVDDALTAIEKRLGGGRPR